MRRTSFDNENEAELKKALTDAPVAAQSAVAAPEQAPSI
jgi:hypothetical protein